MAPVRPGYRGPGTDGGAATIPDTGASGSEKAAAGREARDARRASRRADVLGLPHFKIQIIDSCPVHPASPLVVFRLVVQAIAMSQVANQSVDQGGFGDQTLR